MLKGIPYEISPELMYALMNMGHGDEIVIADGNFPAASNAQILVRADGIDFCAILKAVMQFFPLDTFAEDHAVVMAVRDPNAPEPPIWSEFRKILNSAEGREIKLTSIERFEFYARSRKSYCIVATSEKALYANIILKKGVIK